MSIQCQLCQKPFEEYASGLVEMNVILDQDRKWLFRGCEDCWHQIASRAAEAMRLFERAAETRATSSL